MIYKFLSGGKVLLLLTALALTSHVSAGSVGERYSFGASSSPILRSVLPSAGLYPLGALQKGPQLITQQASYAPDDTVLIGGSDFEPYERVRFSVSMLDKNAGSNFIVSQWDVYADGKGRLSTSWDLPVTASESNSFVVTATGTVSGMSAKVEIVTDLLAGESVTINQCANTNSTPQGKDCPPGGNSGWITGIVGNSKARYFEGDFIAYRNIMGGMNVGKTYKWTVQYDVTKAGLNAIDYLGTYNHTITNANPCRNGAVVNGFCTAGPATSTFAIPTDPKVTAGRDQVAATADDITQIAGVMSMWGGTITAVSVPTYSGPFPVGDESATVDITFVANTTTVVLAWGGHISTRANWGAAFGSVNISGAPYHTANGGLMNITDNTTCCPGSQDLQLQAAAVTAKGKIIIYKHASPPPGIPSFFGFRGNFTTSSYVAGTDFFLSDTASDPSHTGAVPPAGSGDEMFMIADIVDYSTVKRITEFQQSPYTSAGIACAVTDQSGVGVTTAPPNPGPNVNFIDINLQEGDTVSCTFFNDFVTAAYVTVSGRVFDPYGRPLSGAYVSVTDASGATRTARTNYFGYYRFEELEAGNAFYFDVAHKRYAFSAQIVTLDSDVSGLDFNAAPR